MLVLAQLISFCLFVSFKNAHKKKTVSVWVCYFRSFTDQRRNRFCSQCSVSSLFFHVTEKKLCVISQLIYTLFSVGEKLFVIMWLRECDWVMIQGPFIRSKCNVFRKNSLDFCDNPFGNNNLGNKNSSKEKGRKKPYDFRIIQ